MQTARSAVKEGELGYFTAKSTSRAQGSGFLTVSDYLATVSQQPAG